MYPDFEGFEEYVLTVEKWVAHNGLCFDFTVCDRLLGTSFLHCIWSLIDTLVLSRLIDYNIEGGHSLEAWGIRLGYPKIEFHEFDVYSEEMLTYCVRDVDLLYKLFIEIFLPYYESEEWQPAIELEHTCAILAEEMSATGFPFDIDTARLLFTQFTERLAVLDKEIISAFPPKVILQKQITPRATKHGTIHKGDFRWLKPTDGRVDLSPYSIGCPFSRVEFVNFNPGSVKQIVERMNQAGWEPVEKTKKHQEIERELKLCRSRIKRAQLLDSLKELQLTGWKVSEKNLETLPEDAPKAAHKLRERLILARRVSTLEEWIGAYREDTGRIHGTFNTLGCWTHRTSHVGPNFANIVSIDKPYGKDLRSLWRADENHYLVDVDAAGIQLRVLAHYMDDPVFTEALVNGREEDETDVHNLNRKALGEVCLTRKVAKTFIYSWLLGAGVGMTAKVLTCSTSLAKAARESFENFYPGLKNLKQVIIPEDALRGYFVGLDNRKVKCSSEHKMLSGYLQNGEAVVMKTAWVIANDRIQREGIASRFINFVHDEFVCLVDRSVELAELTKKILADAIREAGEQLNLKCPMSGNGDYGITWSEVH